MTDPMRRCPYSKKRGEGHLLSVILPDTVEEPAILFCAKCGSTKPVSLRLPQPLDNLTAGDIARISRPS